MPWPVRIRRNIEKLADREQAARKRGAIIDRTFDEQEVKMETDFVQVEEQLIYSE